jgi:hypothetical protein
MQKCIVDESKSYLGFSEVGKMMAAIYERKENRQPLSGLVTEGDSGWRRIV